MKTALIAGSTGLIGKHLLQLLLESDQYNLVKAITRKPLDFQHPKLENIVVDFDKMTEQYSHFKTDDVFCCLGTTMNQAGSKAAFKKVDYDYPVEIAKVCKSQGAKQYLLVSALGANKKSAIYYNRIKGEVEEAIGAVGYDRYHIFRPSLLMGDRVEKRAGEDAAKLVYGIFGFLIPSKYKGIQGAQVAKSMVRFSSAIESGNFIHESNELQHL
ncbi:MAG: oxidoreductase [Chryseolinea sp.]